jgi:hypothetical protein
MPVIIGPEKLPQNVKDELIEFITSDRVDVRLISNAAKIGHKNPETGEWVKGFYEAIIYFRKDYELEEEDVE